MTNLKKILFLTLLISSFIACNNDDINSISNNTKNINEDVSEVALSFATSIISTETSTRSNSDLISIQSIQEIKNTINYETFN